MHASRCGFLDEHGDPCANAAVKMARVEELNAEVPCCEDCGEDRQVSVPRADG